MNLRSNYQSRAPTRIPPELTDNIILQSRDDKALLATYGLVCRSWVPASRSHLFSEVVLEAKNIGRFIELSRSPHATMACNVRLLVVHAVRKHLPWRHINLLPSFPALEKLILNLMPITVMDLDPSRLYDKFRTATHLALFDCTFNSLDHFNTFLSAFPLVRHLDLNGFHINYPVLRPMTRGLQLPLCTFGIDDSGFYRLMTWLSYDSIPPLRTLYLGSNIVEDSNQVSKLLEGLGPYLHNLHINVDSPMTSSSTSSLISAENRLTTTHQSSFPITRAFAPCSSSTRHTSRTSRGLIGYLNCSSKSARPIWKK
jgi:hypothetical protein